MSKPPFERVGAITNDSHPATPVILGDLDVMKAYPGDPDGGNDGLLQIGDGKAFLPDLELHGPTVFRRGNEEVWLVTSTETDFDLLSEYTEAQIVEALERPFENPWTRVVVAARSGHLVVSIAYNAVPAHGADTSKYDKLCYYKGVPHLPEVPPEAPLALGKTLIVIPVTPGAYEIAIANPKEGDEDDHFVRCRARRVDDAELVAFEAALASEAEDDDDDDDAPVAASAAKAADAGPPGIDVLEKDPMRVRTLNVQVKWANAVFVKDDGSVGVRLCAAALGIDEIARLSLAGKLPLGAHQAVRGRVPESVTALHALVELHVGGPIDGSLPEGVGGLAALRVLHLEEWEGLESLPASLGQLTDLEVLRLPASLRSLPSGLPFPRLRELHLPLDLLIEHEKDLAGLTALTTLDIFPPIDRDDLWKRKDASLLQRELPAGIGSLANLEVLRTTRLGLEALPPGLAKLGKLASLRLWCSRMASLVEVVTTSPSLTSIDTTGNRLSDYEERWLPKLLKLPPAERATAKPPAKKKGDKAAKSRRRLAIASWDAIATFAVSSSGTRIVAGEHGGHRVCAWDVESGKLLWETTLLPGRTVDDRVHVAFDRSGAIVAAPTSFEGHVFWLDAETGAIARTKVIGSAEVSGACFPFLLAEGDKSLGDLREPVPREPRGFFLANVISNAFGGRAAAYSYPEIAGLGYLPGYAGVVSPDGTLVTGSSGTEQLVAMELPGFKAKFVIEKAGYGRHAFTPDGKQLVRLGPELTAHVHDATTGEELSSFPWAPDCAELPSRKRPNDAWPVFDPSGRYLAILRRCHASKIDGTVGILDFETKALVAVLPAHDRPIGRIDPDFGATKLSTPRPDEQPMVRWLGNEVVVGAPIRADDEPRVGTGLTIHTWSPG